MAELIERGRFVKARHFHRPGRRDAARQGGKPQQQGGQGSSGHRAILYFHIIPLCALQIAGASVTTISTQKSRV
jgi:hypothetical protein